MTADLMEFFVRDEFRKEDVHLERLLVYNLLRNPESFATLLPGFADEYLSNQPLRTLFAAFRENTMNGGGLQPDVLVARMNGKLNADYVRQLLASNIDLIDDLREASQILASRHIADQVDRVSRALSADAKQFRNDSDELLQRSQANMERVWAATDAISSENGTYKQDVLEYLSGFQKRIESGTGGILLSTGFESLDAVTLGWRQGDLILIAARPSMGKTSLALNTIEHCVAGGGRAALFSLEMAREEITERLLCSRASISTQSMRSTQLTEAEADRLSQAVPLVANYDLVVDDSTDLTVEQVGVSLYRMHRQRALDLSAVDYLQLMSGTDPRANRNDQIEHISKALKGVAKRLAIPLLAVSQLNRQLEMRANRRPMLSDLRSSGALEQNANIVIFIYRDDYYNKDSETPRLAELNVAKHRAGPLGVVELEFEAAYCRFVERGRV